MKRTMLDIARETVEKDIERIAAAYDRETHLGELIRRPFGTPEEIIEKLERAIRAGQALLARGHYAGDSSRLLALRGALLAERRMCKR